MAGTATTYYPSYDGYASGYYNGYRDGYHYGYYAGYGDGYYAGYPVLYRGYSGSYYTAGTYQGRHIGYSDPYVTACDQYSSRYPPGVCP